MAKRSLKIIDAPRMRQGTLLLALGGWMDGGSVSSGTLRQFMENRTLVHAGRIKPAGFYIDNFPGSMELTAMFRPHVRCVGGLVEELEWAANDFFADPEAALAFFIGKEPNLNWVRFARCIFEMAQRMGIRRIIFMGSFGGAVPHTREPRLYGSVSDVRLLPLLQQHNLRPSDYEGPASFATYLLTLAPRHNMEMLSIAAEIPGYLEGLNPLSIEAVTRRLAAILGVAVNLDALRATSNEWEQQVTEAVEKDEDLAATVRKMEEAYDNELIGEQPGT